MTSHPPHSVGEPADVVMERLRTLRTLDAPTHGGRLLSYVYDSGQAELDELAAQAVQAMLPVNGLDPTAFPSVAVIESEILAFAIEAFGGNEAVGDVVGSVTSGGTESCLLAVKTARDAWRARRGLGAGSVPRLVAPSTVHAAFHKAAHLFDLKLDLVPVEVRTGRPSAADLLDRLDEDVALLVMSAPSYPVSVLDPIAEVAPRAAERGVDVHVDACLGGFAMAHWPSDLPHWDLRVPGVVSLSADLHKYGYAPKGASVLLNVAGTDSDCSTSRPPAGPGTPWSIRPCWVPAALGRRRRPGRSCATSEPTASGTSPVGSRRPPRPWTRRSERSMACGSWGSGWVR